MRTNFLKTAIFLFSIIFLFSCSKDDNPVQEPTPAPVNKALLGLFDIRLNGTIDANLLFESGSHVTYGFPTVADMLSQTGRRSTYVISSNQITFSNSDGATTYNFKCTFEPSTGKLINGTYGTGASYTSSGTFTGQKHAPAASGNDLFKGYWIGRYGNGLVAPNSNYLMSFEEGGKLLVGDSGTYIFQNSVGSGSYTTSGLTVSGTYSYSGGGSTYGFTGTYDASTKKITGTWGIGANSGGGTFYLEMKNNN